MRKTHFTALLSAIPLLLVPPRAWAFQIPPTWVEPVCGFLPCVGGGGAAGLSNYLLDRVVLAIEVGFVAVAIATLFLSAANMVMFAEQEDVVKQNRTQFIYAIAASGVVSFARWIAIAFSPGTTGSDLVNVPLVNSTIGNVLTFFRMGLSVLIVGNVVIQGMRMVNSQGEQEKIERARKLLIGSFVGAGLVMLANYAAISVNPQLGTSTLLAQQIAGIANYFITIVGFGSVVVIMIAGALLVLSVSESLKDKAKTMIKTAIIALVASLVSYALVTTVIFFRS